MSSYNEIAEALTSRFPYYKTGPGVELAKLLNRSIPLAERSSAFKDIARAIKFADEIGSARGGVANGVVDADPLAITRVLHELSYGSGKTVNVPEILAAIIYPKLRIKRANQFAQPDMSQMSMINDFLEKIGGREAQDGKKKVRGIFDTKLGPEVENLVRNTLQLSEINRGGGISGGPQVPAVNPPQTEAELSILFQQMISEVVKDPRAARIRGAQWLIHMRKVTEEHWDQQTPETMARIEECRKLTEQVYVPMASAYGHKELRDALHDQLGRMVNPEEYQKTWDTILDTAQNAAPTGKKGFVRDARTARKIVIEDLAEVLRQIIPMEFRDNCTIEGNIKSAHSAHKKNGEINDIVRLRIIVDEEDPVAAQKIVSKIYAAIDAEANKEDKISFHVNEKIYWAKYESMNHERKERAEKDPDYKYKAPLQGEVEAAVRAERYQRIAEQKRARGEEIPSEADIESEIHFKRPYKNYYKKPKDNGYKALQAVFWRHIREDGETRSTKFEVQILDAKSHYNNEHGTARHDGSYKYSDLPTAPAANRSYTVTVFTPNNGIETLSKPATATDFVVMHHGPDAALSANWMAVKYNPGIFLEKGLFKPTDPILCEGHGAPVYTGSTVLFTTAEDLLKNPAHMMQVINSSQVPGTQSVLKRRFNQLVTLNKVAPEAARPANGEEPLNKPFTP